MSDHERIYLEPSPGADEDYGRQWCQHNVWDEATEYVRADLHEVLIEECDRLREAIKPAYLGLLVLKTMCRKAGLAGGVEATNSAMAALVAVMPELPAISALRPLSPPTAEGRE